MSFTVNLAFKKETKGAVAYHEVNAAGEVLEFGHYKIGTLYFRKEAFPEGAPEFIELTATPVAKFTAAAVPVKAAAPRKAPAAPTRARVAA